MTQLEFTEQEKSDLIQGLFASIHRLGNKIKNDDLHGRKDFNRVHFRKEKIERAKLLIEKLSISS